MSIVYKSKDERPTRKEYEEYLNDLDSERTNMGTWLRRHDPIAFSVGYGEFCREWEQGRDKRI